MMRDAQSISVYDRLREGAISLSKEWFGTPGVRVMLMLWLLPDLVRLMIKLLEDVRVSLLDKLFILSVLLYVIFPIDFLPEMLAGPFGFVEDLLLAGLMLVRLIGNPANAEAIREYWNGDPAVIPKIQQINQRVKQFLSKRPF